MTKIPNAKAHDAKTLAAPSRREHPHAAVIGGSTVTATPRMKIEAHAGAANARRKTLAVFSVHPSMAAQGNRGFAAHKAQAPAAPVAAHSDTGRPTPAPDLHHNAHSAPHGMAKYHSAAQGCRLSRWFQRGEQRHRRGTASFNSRREASEQARRFDHDPTISDRAIPQME